MEVRMDEHEDDVEPEVEEQVAIETEQFPILDDEDDEIPEAGGELEPDAEPDEAEI
jgi:hypothetical protein